MRGFAAESERDRLLRALSEGSLASLGKVQATLKVMDFPDPDAPARELAEQRLAELAYTVFDTETTGLAQAAGDEMLQTGATRIVAGKPRREDCFEQLVDPQRAIPPAGLPIHGIRAETVAGAPTIDEVPPAFHAWAADTVQVAHPSQASHGLEAIAERLSVPVLGRCTALGDAMVTAEVLLKLLPLLAERGIHPLGQALEASQRSDLARVSY